MPLYRKALSDSTSAALPLFNLSYLMATCDPGSLIAAVFLAPQGFASALILRLAANHQK
jgi:hypothetical protein